MRYFDIVDDDPMTRSSMRFWCVIFVYRNIMLDTDLVSLLYLALAYS